MTDNHDKVSASSSVNEDTSSMKFTTDSNHDDGERSCEEKMSTAATQPHQEKKQKATIAQLPDQNDDTTLLAAKVEIIDKEKESGQDTQWSSLTGEQAIDEVIFQRIESIRNTGNPDDVPEIHPSSVAAAAAAAAGDGDTHPSRPNNHTGPIDNDEKDTSNVSSSPRNGNGGGGRRLVPGAFRAGGRRRSRLSLTRGNNSSTSLTGSTTPTRRRSSVPLLEATLVDLKNSSDFNWSSDEEEGDNEETTSNNEHDVETITRQQSTQIHGQEQRISLEPIEVEPVIEAIPISKSTRMRTISLLVVVIAAIVIAVTLGVVLTNSNDNDNEERPCNSCLPSNPDAVVAIVPETICFERMPGAGYSTVCSANETLQTNGGGVANLVALALLEENKLAADVAIINSGMCRSDILAGDFSRAKADEVLPFDGDLIILPVLGSQIRLALEQGVEFIFADPVDAKTGAYPYASRLRFAVNMSAPFGERISDLDIEMDREWGPIDPLSRYQVLINEFMHNGGDGYEVLSEIETFSVAPTSVVDTFLTYVFKEGTVIGPSYEEYTTTSFTPR